MRKALGFCTQQRSFSEVEAEIATYPEFRYVEYSQAAILDILVQVGALEKRNLDKSGGIVPVARLRALSEDDRDDLVVAYALETTEAGKGGHRRYGAGRAPAALFARRPNAMRPTYASWSFAASLGRSTRFQRC